MAKKVITSKTGKRYSTKWLSIKKELVSPKKHGVESPPPVRPSPEPRPVRPSPGPPPVRPSPEPRPVRPSPVKEKE